MKKITIILCLCAILCAGAAWLLWPRSVVFDGDRVGSVDPPRFSLRFNAMNTDDAQTLPLTEGDTLHAAWQIESGSVDIRIALPGEAPLYQADNRARGDAADFDLIIPESGNYTVTVSARKAKGWIEFARKEK